MGQPLLTGVNHVALAARDVDATVAFYCDAFGLEASEIAVEGGERNVLLFFGNGSFLHVIDGSDRPAANPTERAEEGNLLYEGAPIDHMALFAADTDALKDIAVRLVGLDASDGELIDTSGVALTVRFRDPDGRKLEVTAYNG